MKNTSGTAAEAVPVALRDAVAEAYRAFGHRKAPGGVLDVCLACCVDVEIERQLRQWPLAQLTPDHFYQYNTSAKSEEQSADEVGYLLPRMLEVLAEGHDIHHSIELSLDRVGTCPADAWSAAERRALDRFAAAYFDRTLHAEPRNLMDDPLSVALMFDFAGLAIEPLLDAWLRCDDPQATVTFVETTYWDFWTGQDYANAFATDRPEFKAQVRAWLLDPGTRQRFAEKLMSPAFLALAESKGPTGCTDFGTMVGAVFDELTA